MYHFTAPGMGTDSLFSRFVDRDMFMRYQLGMSVGHAYMQSLPAFPPPEAPSIPSNFDHCLDIPPPATRRKGARGEGPSLGEEELEHSGQETAFDDCDDDGEDTGIYEQSLEEKVDLESDDGSGDEGDDYLDDMDDEELVAYTDMYGEDGEQL